MTVYEVSWHKSKIVYRFIGITKWVMRCWKRPFWFSMKISSTLSSNWVIPYQEGCSQFLISSRKFDSSICDWKNEFSIFFVKYHFLCIESFWVDFRCVHRFQLLNVCIQYVILANSLRVQNVSRNNPDKTFSPNWWILDRSRRKRIILNQWNKRYYGSVKGHCETSFLNVSQIDITFHGICPSIFTQTWLQQNWRCSFFHSTHCSFSNPIRFWSVWCWRTLIPGKIVTGFVKF